MSLSKAPLPFFSIRATIGNPRVHPPRLPVDDVIFVKIYETSASGRYREYTFSPTSMALGDLEKRSIERSASCRI